MKMTIHRLIGVIAFITTLALSAAEMEAVDSDYDLSAKFYPASGLTGAREDLVLECYQKRPGYPYLVAKVAGEVVESWRTSLTGYQSETNTFRRNIVVSTQFQIKSQVSWGGQIRSVTGFKYRKVRVYYTTERPFPTF
jgi:hypothetical protein